jgi:transposase-like protein
MGCFEMETRRRKTIGEKRKILAEQDAENLSTHDIARRHGLNTGQIRNWRSNIDRIRNTRMSKKSVGPGRPSDFAAHEPQVLEFVIRQRQRKAGIWLSNNSRHDTQFNY